MPDVRPVTVFVYALTDTDGTVRYIGRTANTRHRLRHHLNGRARAVRAWVESLRARGKTPLLRVLHEVPPGSDASVVEANAIREHESSGKLLNVQKRIEYTAPPLSPFLRRVVFQALGM